MGVDIICKDLDLDCLDCSNGFTWAFNYYVLNNGSRENEWKDEVKVKWKDIYKWKEKIAIYYANHYLRSRKGWIYEPSWHEIEPKVKSKKYIDYHKSVIDVFDRL